MIPWIIYIMYYSKCNINANRSEIYSNAAIKFNESVLFLGTPEKREFLKKRFPQLQDRNFCNSRDTSFEQHILKATNGEGMKYYDLHMPN